MAISVFNLDMNDQLIFTYLVWHLMPEAIVVSSYKSIKELDFVFILLQGQLHIYIFLYSEKSIRLLTNQQLQAKRFLSLEKEWYINDPSNPSHLKYNCPDFLPHLLIPIVEILLSKVNTK